MNHVPQQLSPSQDGSISGCVTSLFEQLGGELPSIHSYTYAVSSAIHTVRKISVHLPNGVWVKRGQEYQLGAFVEIQEKNNEKTGRWIWVTSPRLVAGKVDQQWQWER